MTLKISSDISEITTAAEIAVRDIVGNIKPYTGGQLESESPCLIAGAGYEDPWTRDAGYNCFYGFPFLNPSVARNTLLSVLKRDGHGLRIGGEYWDAMIWAVGAWAFYLAVGDRDFLAAAYEATRASLKYFEETEFDKADNLFRGASTFNDGVSGYPDMYVSPNFASGIVDWVRHFPEKRTSCGRGLPMKALSTNVIYFRAYQLGLQMARELKVDPPPEFECKAGRLLSAIHHSFWMPDEGRFRYLIDDEVGCDRQEGWGHALAILFGVTTTDQEKFIFENLIRTPHGLPCLWPVYARYRCPGSIIPYRAGVHPDMFIEGLCEEDLRPDLPTYGRHCGTVWPQVNASWAMACWQHGHREEALQELQLLAGKAVRDGHFREIYHPETGEPYGGLQEFEKAGGIIRWPSAKHQTWCATGFIAMILNMLCGMEITPAGIHFRPYLPEGMNRLSVENLSYRGHAISLSVARGDSERFGFVPSDLDADARINLFVGRTTE
ncbi:MAG: hypothetical protein KJ626_00740 [Verrucomicrobia bacterium]|nr:hypothetical protein [Verrucomicrobiota bacterium]